MYEKKWSVVCLDENFVAGDVQWVINFSNLFNYYLHSSKTLVLYWKNSVVVISNEIIHNFPDESL